MLTITHARGSRGVGAADVLTIDPPLAGLPIIDEPHRALAAASLGEEPPSLPPNFPYLRLLLGFIDPRQLAIALRQKILPALRLKQQARLLEVNLLGCGGLGWICPPEVNPVRESGGPGALRDI